MSQNPHPHQDNDPTMVSPSSPSNHGTPQPQAGHNQPSEPYQHHGAYQQDGHYQQTGPYQQQYSQSAPAPGGYPGQPGGPGNGGFNKMWLLPILTLILVLVGAGVIWYVTKDDTSEPAPIVTTDADPAPEPDPVDPDPVDPDPVDPDPVDPDPVDPDPVDPDPVDPDPAPEPGPVDPDEQIRIQDYDFGVDESQWQTEAPTEDMPDTIGSWTKSDLLASPDFADYESGDDTATVLIMTVQEVIDMSGGTIGAIQPYDDTWLCEDSDITGLGCVTIAPNGYVVLITSETLSTDALTTFGNDFLAAQK